MSTDEKIANGIALMRKVLQLEMKHKKAETTEELIASLEDLQELEKEIKQYTSEENSGS
jgi:formiminotetrahydrofolate cyclodeaminase